MRQHADSSTQVPSAGAIFLIPWSPRTILTDRLFRLPVQCQASTPPKLNAPGFEVVDSGWSSRDQAWMFYLRTPGTSGDFDIDVSSGERSDSVSVQVRSLADLRSPSRYNGVDWPRRWPLGKSWTTSKQRQTLQQCSEPAAVNEETLQWWTSQSDQVLWDHLPASEFPRAHYVNVHQGCPICGTAIFSFHGFYPWKWTHRPLLRAQCPSCDSFFPSNDLLNGDFSSGEFVDDGFGYFDAEGHVFLFAATSHRNLVGQYGAPVRTLTARLRREFDVDMARQLAIVLLRWAMEEVYLAGVPQFRHGPSQEVECAWDWGQPDWASEPDPIAALNRKGSLAYAIDLPGVGEAHALAYDTIWPLLREDEEILHRVRDLGLELEGPEDGLHLIEESLSAMMQCAVDGAALANKPRTSEGVLTVLHALDRPDAVDVMDWLYDRGPDRLRVFVTNNYTPDGVPPEATGGYNNTHTSGVFRLEELVRHLRALHPAAYPESDFPSLVDEPRIEAIARSPYETTLLGRIPFHFGDGGSAGVQTALGDKPLEPLDDATVERVRKYLGSGCLPPAAGSGPFRQLGSTIHDGVGYAILRTEETPERAATGVIYGDATWHRHMDLLDVQLYAHDRPFLSDLGYPQSWASVQYWEGNWATHNSVWSVVEGVEPLELPFDTPWHFLKQVAGRGHLVRTLRAPGVQIVEVEAERWCFDGERLRWTRPGVTFRRLLALVETDGDGVATIDLARVSGPGQHWRICRGLEGRLDLVDVAEVPVAGTLAGARSQRGDLEGIEHPDHAGLAWMDEVRTVEAKGAWRGTWISRHAPDAFLDVHALQASPGTRVRSARSTAVMGQPEESKYGYRTLAWDRESDGEDTMVDLVFEPRVSEPRLHVVQGIQADSSEAASGVRLSTRSGKQVSLYWNPGGTGIQHFADGTVLDGALALTIDGKAWASGASGLSGVGGGWSFPNPWQQGIIVALERDECTIDVEGLEGVHVGDRIRINPEDRAPNYLIQEVRELASGVCRLRLDAPSVLGRGRIAARSDGDRRLEIDFFLITRTGYLHEARLERESDGEWRRIEHAMNVDAASTVIEVDEALVPLQESEWVRAVTCVVGDPVSLEPVRTLV